jgi:hypothetical protein
MCEDKLELELRKTALELAIRSSPHNYMLVTEIAEEYLEFLRGKRDRIDQEGLTQQQKKMKMKIDQALYGFPHKEKK